MQESQLRLGNILGPQSVEPLENCSFSFVCEGNRDGSEEGEGGENLGINSIQGR